MSFKGTELQDDFIQWCVETKNPLTVFLINGVKLQGKITNHDAVSLLLERDESKQLLFKHTIATIMPSVAA
jgi:host factor-I protein